MVKSLLQMLLNPEFGPSGIAKAGGKAKAGSTLAFTARVPIKQDPLAWSKHPALLVQIKFPDNNDVTMLRLEFSPAGLTPSGFGYLLDHVLWGCLQRSVQELRQARVTRFDAALDLPGVQIDNFAWGISKWSRRTCYVKDTAATGYTLGSAKSAQMVIYDKAREADMPPQVELTRVEFRGKPGCTLENLITVENPFKRLSVLDVPKLAATLSLNGLPARSLPYLGHKAGPKLVLKELGQTSPEIGKKAKVAAEGVARPNWWKPEQHWSNWPAVLGSQLCGLVG